ncbi:MAG TPA: plastocyanin/azurin family copper-binding protein [Longimicrobiaceae bacterium]|nr:plastocyanin/azurin family copper-binding protein [Longimicrobiaceae bacterium]
MRRVLATLPLLLLLTGFARSQPPQHVISQKEKAFSRSQITVRAGEAIAFRNDDVVIHNVFSTSPGFEFNLKKQAPGAAGAVPFRQRGSAQVRCAFHPQMKLTVTVN